MERKFKGIALMILGVNLFVVGILMFVFSLPFIAFLIGILASAILQLIGLYLVFSNEHNETEKIIQDFIDGKDE